MTYRVTESGPYTFILSHSPETDLRNREKGRITESEQYESQDRAWDFCTDNKASTFTANTPSTGVRSKHIDVRFLKVREYVANGELRVVHVRTDYNVADFFTKGLTLSLIHISEPTRPY